jgi:ribonuclease P protein component
MPAPSGSGFRFSRRQRLSKSTEFAAVYGAKVRKGAGPFVVFGMPNGLQWSRLGLSVGKRVGGAVRRNRVKRLLREAFRLEQHAMARGLDLVVTVRAHEDEVALEDCRRLMVQAVSGLETEWARRRRRSGGTGAASSGGDADGK